MADFDPSEFSSGVPDLPGTGQYTPEQQAVVNRIQSGQQDYTFGPASPDPTPEDKATYVGGPASPASGFAVNGGVALAPKEYNLFTPDQRKKLGIMDIAPRNQAGKIERYYGGNAYDEFSSGVPSLPGGKPSETPQPQMGYNRTPTIDDFSTGVPDLLSATKTPPDNKNDVAGRVGAGIAKAGAAYAQGVSGNQPAQVHYNPPQVPVSQGNPVQPIAVSPMPFNRSAAGMLNPEPSRVTAGTEQNNPFTGKVASQSPMFQPQQIALGLSQVEQGFNPGGVQTQSPALQAFNREAAQRVAPLTSEAGLSMMPAFLVPGYAEAQSAIGLSGVPQSITSASDAFRSGDNAGGIGQLSGAAMDTVAALLMARSGRFGQAASDAAQGLLEKTNRGLAVAAQQVDIAGDVAAAKTKPQDRPTLQQQFPPTGVGNEAFATDYGAGEIVEGTGKSAKQWQSIGSARLNKWLAGDMSHDPYAALSRAKSTGNVPPEDMALMSAEHARLLNNAAAADQLGKPDWQARAQQAHDFAQGIQSVKGIPSDTFRAMQSVRQSRYDSLVDFDRAIRDMRAGNGLTPQEEALFRPMAKEIQTAMNKEQDALSKGLDSSNIKSVPISLLEANARIGNQIAELLKPCNL